MSDTPQFSTAEYLPPQIERCGLCGTPLASEYYRVHGQTACASCASAAQNGQANGQSNTAFTRALLFGIGAATVGLAGYAAFTIATSFYIGYVALGVGYIVARAMKFGSGGLGGRPFQIVAVILTYLAIALAEIPIALWEVRDSYSVPDACSSSAYGSCPSASLHRFAKCATPFTASSIW